MSRKIRQTKDNNIVIVCEGSETEAPYFEALKAEVERMHPLKYAKILVVPVVEEKIKVSVNRSDKKKRALKPAERTYWIHQEETQELYNEYCSQPVKYVREAELFMQRDGFVEAWAVFDHDNLDVRYRRKAFEHAETVDNLNIAFSSVAFEEWILAHFERNSRPFEKAQCKERGKAIDCGKNPDVGCDGNRCLAGYLRKQLYLPDYEKNDHALFDTLRSRFDIARINAAWLRHLEDGPIYDRNPYTDVDRLVSRLLGIDKEHVWIRFGEEFKYNGTKIKVEKACDKILIKSESACVISKDNLISTDLAGNENTPLLKNLAFSGVSSPIYVNAPYLQFKSESKSFFIDLVYESIPIQLHID